MYPDGNDRFVPSFHANLGGVLRLRWQRTGSQRDLDDSLTAIRKALAVTHEGHPQRFGRLGNLADGLLALHRLHQDSSALTEAVELYRQALRCAPSGDATAAARANLPRRFGHGTTRAVVRIWPPSTRRSDSPGPRSPTCHVRTRCILAIRPISR